MKLANLLEVQKSVLTEQKMRIPHPEDMIFDKGLAGAIAAMHGLQATANSPQNISVKFDGCIHPDSVLLTEFGEMTILDIINDTRPIRVLVHNFDTGCDEYHVAEYPRINNNDKNWIKIDLENGSHITVTEDHEVHVVGKGWIQAKNIKPNDDITEYQKK